METWVDRRHRGQRLLRPAAGQDHRARRATGTAAARAAERAGSDRGCMASRPISSGCARSSRSEASSRPRSRPPAAQSIRVHAADRRGAERRHLRRPCRIIPAASATGMWACRPRARWTPWRFASATGCSAMQPDAAGPGDHRARARPCVRRAARVCLTGAALRRDARWRRRRAMHAVAVHAGQTLSSAASGRRPARLPAVTGGIDVPVYLGSRSTFTLGRFGGHAGRALRRGRCAAPASERARLPRRHRCRPSRPADDP